jgi:hypothetical protein
MNNFLKKVTIKIVVLQFICISLFVSSAFSSQGLHNTRESYILQLAGEIEFILARNEKMNFLRISSICCDNENNLYVADIGWCKIFKFNPQGKFITSFGGAGQAPGNFLGDRRINSLKISFGKDNKIYVVDTSNSRLNVFTKEGVFIKHYILPQFFYDTAAVNSSGDIYLLSRSGIKVVDCYDSNFKYKGFILDLETSQEAKFIKLNLSRIRYLNDNEYIKFIDNNDNLVIFSNYSYRIFYFDQNNNFIRECKIREYNLDDDLERRFDLIKSPIDRKDPQMLEKYILPFFAYLDRTNSICLVYQNSRGFSEIYRFTLKGELLDVLKFPNFIDWRNICSDSKGKIFATKEKRTKIGVYKIKRR